VTHIVNGVGGWLGVCGGVGGGVGGWGGGGGGGGVRKFDMATSMVTSIAAWPTIVDAFTTAVSAAIF